MDSDSFSRPARLHGGFLEAVGNRKAQVVRMTSSIYSDRENLQGDPDTADPLTRLRQVTEYELRSAARYRRFATLALIDSPHPGLSLFDLLSELIRGSDEAVRLGDNTVAILMGETDSTGAMAAIRRFRQRCGGGIELRCAIASFPSDGRDAETLLDQAWTRHAAARAASPDLSVCGDPARRPGAQGRAFQWLEGGESNESGGRPGDGASPKPSEENHEWTSRS